MKLAHKLIGIILVSICLIISLAAGYKILRWKMYIWLPDYISQKFAHKEKTPSLVHIMFMTVDHYEPGMGTKGAEINRSWLNNYRILADSHKDSYGRVPQHSWFYSYDHKNDQVMMDLSQFVLKGYGEIEFHWHHSKDNNVIFPEKLEDGVKWFNSYGAMIDVNGQKSFAFIHGNWSLDNAKGENSCGVSRELEILKSKGCYGDFTFPAFGDASQPRKVNSIYYASDDERNKSYDSGSDAKVGVNNKGFMIFEGPLSLNDYGAIETDPYPDEQKIDGWIKSNIHVKGRPDWIFIKTYTHGIQSRKLFFSKVVDNMYSYLENHYSSGKYRLHYVTTREAFNIVKAAEDGKSGDPHDYLNYKIGLPVNKIPNFNSKSTLLRY